MHCFHNMHEYFLIVQPLSYLYCLFSLHVQSSSEASYIIMIIHNKNDNIRLNKIICTYTSLLQSNSSSTFLAHLVIAEAQITILKLRKSNVAASVLYVLYPITLIHNNTFLQGQDVRLLSLGINITYQHLERHLFT